MNENLSLRTLSKTLKNQLDAEIKKFLAASSSLKAAQAEILRLQGLERSHSQAIDSMRIDYNKALQQANELMHLKSNKENEISEMTETLKNLSEENQKLQGELSKYKSQANSEDHDVSALKIKSELSEKRLEALKEKLSKKNDELQLFNEKYNKSQLRFFTINQEYESLKQSTTREIDNLQKSLKSHEQQNTLLLNMRFKLEEKLKGAKGAIEYDKLKSELKDFKLLCKNLEQMNNMLAKDKFKDGREFSTYAAKLAEMKHNMVGNRDAVALSNQNDNLKKQLRETLQLNYKVNGTNEKLVRQFDREMKAIKIEYHKIDKGFKLAQSSFKLKCEEFKKVKDEMELVLHDKRRMMKDLETAKILQNRITTDLCNASHELEKSKEETERMTKRIIELENTVNSLVGENKEVAGQKVWKDSLEENKKITKEKETCLKQLEGLRKKYKTVIQAANQLAMKHGETFYYALGEEVDFDKQFLDQEVIKKGLQDLVSCLEELGSLAGEVVVRPITGKEDFEFMITSLRRLVDQLMVNQIF